MNREGFCVVGLALSLLPSHAQSVNYSSDASGSVTQRASGATAPPKILGQPQSQIVIPGELASFSVLVADSSGCAYQWRFFGTNLLGQTRDALLILDVSANHEGPYSVVANNSSGSVTSSIAPLYIDSNRNGMPDSWELAYFGNLNQNAIGDFDADGTSNLKEFLDGTNPTNSTSFRSRLTVFSDGGGEILVTPEQPDYASTDSVTLTATPFLPNLFSSWTGDLTSHNNPATLTMNSNKTVRAHFACSAPPSGMVGWWRAENDASDALGLNPGSLSNGVTFAAGQVGQAFHFTGTNQEVKVSASTSLNLGTGNGLTIEAWIQPATLVNQYPIAEWNDGTISGVHFWANAAFSGRGGPGCLYANLRDTGLGDHSFFSANGLLSTGAWNHVALTYDRASGIANMFLNGFIVASANLGGFVPLTATNLHLGYRPGSASFAGLLDEVTVYNRALAASEVLALDLVDAAGKCSNLPYIVSPVQFPDAIAGVAYTQSVVSVIDPLPVTFSLSAGTLPMGLALSPSGVLNGIPTGSGSNVFAVLATDSAGFSSEKMFGLNVAPAPVAVSPPGLLAWWRAENNAQDYVGAHHGVPSNGVTYVAGKVGQSFSFDGTNSYVVAPDTGLPSGNAPRTVEFWMQYAAGGQGNHEPFFYGSPSVGSSFYVIVIGNRLYIGRFGGGDTPGSTIATDGNWHHVALTHDGYLTRMYVDGQLDASSPRVYSTVLNGSFYMGEIVGFPDRFKGQVDELAVYNRALSDSEIAALYSAGAADKVAVGPYVNAPLPDAILGQQYAQSLSAVLANPPVSYAVESGGLPPGLTLSPIGLVGGIPTNSGSYNFVLRATDSASLSRDTAFALRVFAAVPPPPGLVSWWRAETNALDAAGTNDGGLRNGVTFTVGKVGEAFSLDGGSQSVEVPDAPSLRTTSVTLETWALFTAGGTRAILGKPVGPGFSDSYQIFIANGNLGGFVGDAASLGPQLTSQFSPVPGDWYHLAYTFDDSTKQQALYLNGSQVASGVANKTIGYDSQPMLLGRDTENGSPNFFFPGLLDEAAIYNRALGSNEIASIFNAGPAGKTLLGPAFGTPPSLPFGVVHQAYTQTLGLARGTALSFVAVAGAPPPGLTLSPAGVLSGTPTTAGEYRFVARATDSSSLTADQPFSLQVLSQASPPGGLVGWWRAENNTADSIGGNDGFLINAATFAPGKVGQAFSLNGVNDAVEIEDAPALRPSSVTLEAWVMFFSPNGIQTVMAKALGNGIADSYVLWLENGNLKGAISDITGASNPISVPFSPVVGQWYHVVFSFDDATRQQILYVNGSAVAYGLSNLSIGYDTHPLFLGADDENGSMAISLQGRIDEAAIYNRALNSSEVALIYNADAAGKSTRGPYLATSPSLPDAATGQVYTQILTSERGTLPVTYALVGGTLPAGLALNSQGVLGGTPSIDGFYTFKVRATDAAGLLGEQTFSLRVAAPVPPPAGLVSWWRAENTAQDSVGENNGVILNGTSYAEGKVGQAFTLDGINDFVQIPDSLTLQPASLTLETWVMFGANNGIRVIFTKPLGTGILDSYSLWLENGNLRGVVANLAGSGPILSVPFSPVLGQWYHLAFTFDDSTRQQVLYLNGVTIASGLSDRSIGYDSQPLLLGCDIDNGNHTWFVNGRIDEAALYNRALTAAEVALIYNAGPAGKIPTRLILTASLESQGLLLSFASTPGQTYTLEYADSLNNLSWTVLTNLTASATATMYTNSASNPQQRFFRVRTTAN